LTTTLMRKTLSAIEGVGRTPVSTVRARSAMRNSCAGCSDSETDRCSQTRFQGRYRRHSTADMRDV
jgi:hypothetical protein